MIWSSVTFFATVVLVMLIILILWGLGWFLRQLSPVLWPLAIAGGLAYLLDPVVNYLEKFNISRLRAIILVFAIVTAAMAGVLGGVLPQVIREANQFVERVPKDLERVKGKVETWMTNTNPPSILERVFELKKLAGILPGVSDETNGASARGGNGENGAAAVAVEVEPDGSAERTFERTPPEVTVTAEGAAPESTDGDVSSSSSPKPDWTRALDSPAFRSATAWLSEVVPTIGSWVFGQFGKLGVWFGFLAGIFLVPVYVFFFLVEKQGISRQWTAYLPVRNSRFKDELVFCLGAINDYLIVFFRSQVLVAMCDGILYTIGFLLIGLPYAFLIGLLSVFLTIIPFLGATVICSAALVIGFASTGSWQLPALVVLVFTIVQTAEGLLIQPKIVGDRVGLHPLSIIVAVLVGTTLFGGLLGGILAIPLTAAMRVIMFRYVWVKRNVPEDVAAESLKLGQ